MRWEHLNKSNCNSTYGNGLIYSVNLCGINEDFADKLNEFVLNGYTLNNEDEYFSCGYANNILEACGLDKSVEIVITQSGMKKILGQKHGKQDIAHDLTPIEVLRLPQLIRDPILVIKGNTSDTRLVFVEIPRQFRKVFAVIELNKDMVLLKRNYYNLIASAYSSENYKVEQKIKSALTTDNVWYYDSRKIKNWLSAMGQLQLLPLLEANSLFSEKDFSDSTNVEKKSEQKSLGTINTLEQVQNGTLEISLKELKTNNGTTYQNIVTKNGYPTHIAHHKRYSDAINDYLNFCDKYGIDYNLNGIMKGIDEDFADKLNYFIENGYTLENRYDYFSCGYANNILEACGLDKSVEIVITQSGMKKILGQKHGKQDNAHDLTPIEVLRLPQLIQKPILVITGNTSDTRLIFVEIPRAGRKMFAAIDLDANLVLKNSGGVYNLVASVYSSENYKVVEKIVSASATNNVWYYDNTKIKSWLSVIGQLQLLPNITTNSLFSEKDFSDSTNVENSFKNTNLSGIIKNDNNRLHRLHLTKAKAKATHGRLKLRKLDEINDKGLGFAMFRFSDTKEQFEQNYFEAVERRGIVREDLDKLRFPIYSLKNVQITRQKDFFASVYNYAKEHKIIGEHTIIVGNNIGTLNIGRSFFEKCASNKAIKKSDTFDVHKLSIVNILDIVNNSFDIEIHPNILKNVQGKRECIENTKIELLDRVQGTPSTPLVINNSISVTILLKNVEKSYDKGVFLIKKQNNTISDTSKKLL